MDATELADEFARQAEWRRQKATELPDDAMNEAAAKIFDRLAASVAACPKDVLDEATFLFEDLPDAELWHEMLRQVGFHSEPTTAEEFCRQFIAGRTS